MLKGTRCWNGSRLVVWAIFTGHKLPNHPPRIQGIRTNLIGSRPAAPGEMGAWLDIDRRKLRYWLHGFCFAEKR